MSRRDNSTLADLGIDYPHHEIHDGWHFFYESYSALEDTDAVDIAVQTADSKKWLHFVWQVLSKGEITFQVYEGSTITWDGTNLVARNNNRNSANVSSLVEFQEGPTVTAVGTLLAEAVVGSASNPNQGIPGGGERNNEVILAQDTVYLFRITSGVNGNIASYLAEWYEHTDKVQ